MLTFPCIVVSAEQGLIQGLLMSASSIYEQNASISRTCSRSSTCSRRSTASRMRLAVPRPMRQGFTFENVRLSVSGEASGWAVRNVSFTIHPGERVALVGENGAGKTTLTKLIARLYDPTEGRLLLDGRRSQGIRPWREGPVVPLA